MPDYRKLCYIYEDSEPKVEFNPKEENLLNFIDSSFSLSTSSTPNYGETISTSEIALGTIVRAFNLLKIAYVNLKPQKQFDKTEQFFENLFFNEIFYKSLKNNLDFFKYKNFSFEKLFLPNIEYQTLPTPLFLRNLKTYDLIIIDNIDFNYGHRNIILDILENFISNNIVFIFKNQKDAKNYKDKFDLISEVSVKTQNNLLTSKNLISIFGNGKGKTTFLLGLALKNLILNKPIRYIAFDKGGKFYSELKFLYLLKKYSFRTKKIDFDFIYTGMKRFDEKENKFRFENIKDDYYEALEGLSLLKTILRKRRFITFADELNTTLLTKLLKKENLNSLIEKLESPLIISGRIDDDSNLNDYASTQLEIREIKHYISKGFNVKKGIDY